MTQDVRGESGDVDKIGADPLSTLVRLGPDLRTLEAFAYLPARLHVPCKAVCKSCSAIVSMVPFQFRVAVGGMPRLVRILLLIRKVFIRKFGQPFIKAAYCLIVRFKTGVFRERIRLGALEVPLSCFLHEQDAGVVNRIKSYALVVLVVESPPSTIMAAPFRCWGICVSYADGATPGFARRRGDCESCIVFVWRLSVWNGQKAGEGGRKVDST